ncbi:hypothetical protein [Ectopseudomonas khazarica]|uniref:hypothetical protein n=1 Tax=Ectopseudomonas khazarica TaxID=2502979 RepID=UPI0037C655DD
MSRFEPFVFFDGLTDSAKNKLPEGLRISGDNDPELLILLRLLSGNLGVLLGEKKILQKVNYFSPDLTAFGSMWAKKFPPLLGEDLTIEDVDEYVRIKKFANKPFYREILYEALNFFVHQKRGAHTSAFIYLYRLLERVSYCFPLIYVSMTDDFKRTYNVIKSFFGDSKDKDELGFFKTFIDTIFKNDAILDTTVDFDFFVSGQDSGGGEKLCSVVKGLLGQDFKKDGLLGDSSISVEYGNVGRFIITIRNGFFHNLSRKNNINSEELRDSDNLFRLINDRCLYWISSVLLAVISYNISTTQLSGEASPS